MKRWLLFFLLVTGASINVKAQGSAADTAFKFNHYLSRWVNHWIVFPKQNSLDAYPFGFVYIDPADGFVFNLEGFFKADGNGRFSRIKMKIDQATHDQYILKTGPQPAVAIIDPDHYEELDIYPRPDWFYNYNNYTDTAEHVVQWAKAYNGIHDYEMVLSVALPQYEVTPHYAGLEKELAHAYNELHRYDDAIKITDAALINDVGNPSLYKESGNAMLGRGRVDEAISTYASGIKLCDATDAEEKSEMAMNLAKIYLKKGNKQAYSQWIIYAKLWAPRKSDIARVLEDY